MPDAETFKLIMNGGLFGLFVLFFVWLLFKAEPNYRATVEKLSDDHRLANEKMAEDHKVALQTVCDTFAASLARQFVECREERREMYKDFQETVAKEFELNRENRHEVAQTMMKAIREAWKRSEGAEEERKSGGSKEHNPM